MMHGAMSYYAYHAGGPFAMKVGAIPLPICGRTDTNTKRKTDATHNINHHNISRIPCIKEATGHPSVPHASYMELTQVKYY